MRSSAANTPLGGRGRQSSLLIENVNPRSTEASPAKKSSKGRAGTIVKKRSTKIARNDRDNSDIFDVPKFYMPVQLAERDEMVEFEEDEDEYKD